MIIVVTGMVGIDKKNYLEKVCSKAKKRGKEVTLCNVGDMMYEEARDIPAGKILDISMKRLSSLRRSVFKDIITKSAEVDNLIVNTHATFRWQHGLFPAVDFDQMRQLGADIYVTLIDSVPSLHLRLINEHSIRHTLKDLIVWREEENISTEMLCKGIDERVGFYVLGRGNESETVETFYKLIFEADNKKAYLSFPMTHVSKLEDVKAKINDFRKVMGNIFTCFDPGDVEESHLPWLGEEAKKQGLNYVEVEALKQRIRLDLDEVMQITRDINSQTYARDFMLIDQADMIISYIPTLPDGRAAISSGVERELQHAHEAAKDVYVIWTPEDAPSIFVTQTATKVFSGMAEAVEYFEMKGYFKSGADEQS